MSYPSKSFLYRHKLISAIRDIDLKGFRRFSLLLPKLLLPNPKYIGTHIINTIHGVKLLIDPSKDQGVELSLFQTGTYEKGTIRFILQHLKKGDRVLDIGANIGLMSILASKHIGKSGIVYAFEANPKTVEILQSNIQLNNCNNIQLYPIALSNTVGEALLFENWNVNRGGASLYAQNKHEKGIPVETECLDNLFDSKTQIDLVKIDVEGFEAEVLLGGKELFETQKPLFIVEVSNQRELEKGASPVEIFRLIQTFGTYTFYKNKGTKERKSKLIPILTESDLPEHDNIYCIPVK